MSELLLDILRSLWPVLLGLVALGTLALLLWLSCVLPPPRRPEGGS